MPVGLPAHHAMWLMARQRRLPGLTRSAILPLDQGRHLPQRTADAGQPGFP